MNIWEAYCNHRYYNIYFDLLVAKGMKREGAEDLKGQYFAYLQRIKTTRFAQDLKAIDSAELFLSKLREIFEVKWKDHININYKDIVQHFYNYLTFLDSIQALYCDFINKDEEERLTNIVIEESLTDYETEYLVDGKLVALMNPTLLYILREYIVERNIAPSKVAIACKNFYGKTLAMSSEDYVKLINNIWHPSRKVKKGGKRNQIYIQYPDGTNETVSTKDALKKIVCYYGFENVFNKHLQTRNENFLVKYVTIGKEKMYEAIDTGQYIHIQGNSKDRMNLVRTINIMFGSKLKLEMI